MTILMRINNFFLILSKCLRPNTDEVTGECRELHNEEHNVLYCSPSIVRGIESRRMRLAGNEARMGEERRLQDFGEETGGKEIIWETQT